MNKNFLIPVNDVPNTDELLGISDSTLTSVSESRTTDLKIDAPPHDNLSNIDFVWGFFFFSQHEIYAEGNTIFFNGEVSKESMNELKRTLIYVGKRTLAAYHELGVHDTKNMHINLHINSPGGCMSQGWDMIDFIDKFYLPIHTYGTGTVASMGVMLLLSGSKRFITANTHILIHQFRAGVQGKRQDIMDYVKHFENMHKQAVEYIASKTVYTEEEINELLKNETWLTAEVAVQKGFVEKIA